MVNLVIMLMNVIVQLVQVRSGVLNVVNLVIMLMNVIVQLVQVRSGVLNVVNLVIMPMNVSVDEDCFKGALITYIHLDNNCQIREFDKNFNFDE